MKVFLAPTALRVNTPQLEVAGVVLSGSIELSLKPGVVHAIQGPNGVGKSTFLSQMGNALTGQVHLFKPEFGLRGELTVAQHVALVLQHLRLPQQHGENLLREVGLHHWALERIATLSSGQRARLGLCAALAHACPVWLFDEPLNALDQEGLAVLAKAMDRHLNAGGFLLMATHIDPAVLMAHAPGLRVSLLRFDSGQLVGAATQPEQAAASLKPSAKHSSAELPATTALNTVSTVSISPLQGLARREFSLLWAQPQMVLWGALFHWMVLSFFGIGLGKPSAEFVQVAVWVSVLLSLMLAAKDWFVEDWRVGWLRLLSQWNDSNFTWFWLIRVLVAAVANLIVLLPVTGLVALQMGLSANQSLALLLALAAGLWASAPLLGLVALLVMLTRGGAVLVYLLALPLLVPVLIFGLEASQAADFGRSAFAPLALLVSMGLLGCVLGPVLAKHLNRLIQE